MINYWAVLVSAVAAMVIGSIWWGPLFGKYWIKENGLDKLSPDQQEKMKKGMGMLYVQQFILSIIQGLVIAHLLNVLGRTGAMEGAKFGVVFWLGFMFPVHYGAKLWGNKSFKFVFLTTLSSLLTLVVAGLIIGGWR